MKMNFEELLKPMTCPCGRVHQSSVKKIVMERGALDRLTDVIGSLGDYRHIVMICDRNTYRAAGEAAETLIRPESTIILDPAGLHADEHGVGAVAEKLPEEADLLIAVGSGTVHDITRFTAHKHGIPFVSVPTAASVDGYVANVAAMTWKGVKKTFPACAPIAMVADIDVIANAPMRLTASGVGDMLGKYTALTDWKVAHLLTGEYLCERIVSLVEQALDQVRDSVERLADRDPAAVYSLMCGLVFSGVAMQLSGNSRPASGAEHHVSHFIEMTVPADVCGALHGEKVGVGLLMVSDAYRRFAALSDREALGILNGYRSADEEKIRNWFGGLADEILQDNRIDCAQGITADTFAAALPGIRAVIGEKIPTADALNRLLEAVGACRTLEDIGLHSADRNYYLSHAPLARNRLTLMRLISGDLSALGD